VAHPTLETLATPGVAPFVAARLLRAHAGTLLRTTLAWHVFDVGGRAFDLGLLGVFEFLPVIPLGLVAGAVADAYDRTRVAAGAQVGIALAAAFLAALGESDLAALFAIAFATAVFGAFEMPALASILPGLVPRERFPSAVSLVAALRNAGWVSGPLVAGFLIDAAGVRAAYALSAALSGVSALALLVLPRSAGGSSRREVSLAAIREGIAFVRRERSVLGAMTLDLFAVIFAGATALLPVYAEEILQVGPRGYGLLSAGLTIGTFAMSAVLVTLPPLVRPGRALLVAVAVFGVATIAFGFSRWFPLSLGALVVAGMADEVSMVARTTIIQLATPDALRGRVSAVNAIFVGASNELGAAESGFLAAATSATFSVVFGGVACLGVLAAVARRAPELRGFRVTAISG
jgi:MFS family permease